uniref:DUF6881 domain-containing protein n=1 Tax=Agathobacter sp. TaxID=2021311 RepID=UPI0040563A78
MEYIKLYWKHNFEDEPVMMLYEVDTEQERLAFRSIDVFADGKTSNIADLYEGAIEITAIPTVEEFHSHIWGEEFFACLITKEEFEKMWNR